MERDYVPSIQPCCVRSGTARGTFRRPITSAGASSAPPAAMPSVPATAPGVATPSAATEADGIYIVKRGESLADIASKVGLTEGQLLSLNNIRNRDFIFEGQQLAIKPGVQPPAQQIASATETGGRSGVVDRTGAAAVASAPTASNNSG